VGRAGDRGRPLTIRLWLATAGRAGAIALAAVAVSSSAAAAGGFGAPDFGIRLAGPVDPTGRTLRTPVVAGVPFLVRLELSASGFSGGASIGYDIELPTGVHVADNGRRARAAPLENGLRTSSCLHACTIGWDTGRSRTLSVYYVFVVPVAADAMLSAHITATNHPDADAADDRDATSVTAVEPRLTLGSPQLFSGPPRESKAFVIIVPLRLNGAAVRPDSVRCTAVLRGATLRGAASRRPGAAECAWTLPRNSGGASLRSTVRVSARSLRTFGTWFFAVGR
jgi:hypothetical protein